MDHERFRDWFSHVDDLTAAQREEVAAALSGRPQGRPRWRRSNSAWTKSGAVRTAAAAVLSLGARRAVCAARCKACGKTFGAHRHGAVGSAPQGALAVVRRVVGRRGDGYARLPRAAGLLRARRIAGATASWRRSGKRRTGLPGSSRPTRPSCREPEGRAEAEPQAAPARRQGPQTRPLARAGSCAAGAPQPPALEGNRPGESERARRLVDGHSRHSEIKGFLRAFRGIDKPSHRCPRERLAAAIERALASPLRESLSRRSGAKVRRPPPGATARRRGLTRRNRGCASRRRGGSGPHPPSRRAARARWRRGSRRRRRGRN